MANVLVAAERRRRLTETDSRRFIRLLSELPIAGDDAPPLPSLDTIMTLGRSHGLSAYDAAYLDLAMREGVPLASRDRALIDAASACGISIVQPG